ncbi:MAG TPA: TIGR03084 family metal-binding protein [Actinomycetota bacterium]|nr:TIGR03084 family metal-binding protein [Actinomycetota bacterium]
MPALPDLCSDLATEQAVLDDIVSSLEKDAWDTPTPAAGWTVRDQISHLAFFEEQAHRAITDPDGFSVSLGEIAADPVGFMSGPLERGRSLPAIEVLAWWRKARTDALDGFSLADPGRRVPWFGPPMSPASFITARIMETWAHGQDVVDALGVGRAPTERLRHVAHLGVKALPYSFHANGLETPDAPVRVELRAPSGDIWSWGESAPDKVGGPALDFCLVVTQRRHVDDTDLDVQGETATRWMSIAQAFAGPPGEGRKPGQFARRAG